MIRMLEEDFDNVKAHKVVNPDVANHGTGTAGLSYIRTLTKLTTQFKADLVPLNTQCTKSESDSAVCLFKHTLTHDVMLHSHCFSMRSLAHHMFIGLNGKSMLKGLEKDWW